MYKTLFIELLGLGVIASPLDTEIKLAVAAIASVTGVIKICKAYSIYSRVKSRTHELSVKAALFESDYKQNISEAEKKLEELQTLEGKLIQKGKDLEILHQNYILDGEGLIKAKELEASRILNQAEYEVDKLFQSKKLKIEQELLQTKTERSQQQADIEVGKTILVIEQARWQAQKQNISAEITQERDRWEAERARKNNVFLSEIDRRREQAESNIESLRLRSEGENEMMQTQIESERRLLLAEKTYQLAEIEKLQLAWEEQKTIDEQRHGVKLEKLKERMLDQVAVEHEESIQQSINEAITPVQQKLEKALGQIQILKERLVQAHEAIARQKKPIKPNTTDVLSIIAWRLISLYEARGVYIDFKNVYQHENAVFVMVEPCEWQYHGQFQRKTLNKFFDDLVLEFKLEGPPELTLNSDGYVIILRPRNFMFLGAIPPMPNEPLVKRLVEELRPEDITSQGMFAEHNFELEKMLSFIEPSVPAPKSGEITQTEIDWVKFLYEFREQAAGQPCMRSQFQLLERIWGVTPGRKTDEEIQLDGKTIRQRLHEIMDMLNYKRQSRGKNDES